MWVGFYPAGRGENTALGPCSKNLQPGRPALSLAGSFLRDLPGSRTRRRFAPAKPNDSPNSSSLS